MEDGLICAMKKEDFDRLVQMVSGLSVRVTKMMRLRRWKPENKLLDLLHSTVEQRLSKTFLNLFDDFGVPHGDGHLLKLKLTLQDFADLIASTRETVTATLNKLKSRGIVDYEGKYLVLKSPDRLRTIVGGASS